MASSPNKRKTYITPEGAKKLQDELDYLWNVERRKVTREVADAAAQGDRSENAEYIYGKKRLREIDSRVRFLGKRLDEVIIVRPGEVGTQEKIYFGAWVTLEDEAGEEHRYRLVGPDETDVGRGQISVASPMGRVLIGKEEGGDAPEFLPRSGARLLVPADDIHWRVAVESRRAGRDFRAGAGNSDFSHAGGRPDQGK